MVVNESSPCPSKCICLGGDSDTHRMKATENTVLCEVRNVVDGDIDEKLYARRLCVFDLNAMRTMAQSHNLFLDVRVLLLKSARMSFLQV